MDAAPLLKVVGESARGTRFDVGPTNWARVLVIPHDPDASAREATKFNVVYAFDTQVARDSNRQERLHRPN